MKLSIVTTFYDSAATVAEFHRRATASAKTITDDYEIVMVDDGSPDNSLSLACAIAEEDDHVRVVELSRNFGHHKALMTGLDHAKGDLCFLIDSDLEEAPEVLKEFFDALRGQDVDVVYGYQTSRKGNPIESKGGRLAWSLIDYLYSIQIPRNQCTVRLMLREYVDALLRHRESNTVIGGLWVITGFKQVGMPINKGHRGQSSYNLLKRIETLVNGITSFSTAPLLFMLYFGIFVSLVSFLLGLGVLAQKLIYNSASGWASLIVSIWFLDGVIVFGLGLIGLYISRIFVETKNRPYVIVRRIHERKKAG